MIAITNIPHLWFSGTQVKLCLIIEHRYVFDIILHVALCYVYKKDHHFVINAHFRFF